MAFWANMDRRRPRRPAPAHAGGGAGGPYCLGSQRAIDVVLQRLRLHGGRVAGEDFAVAADEEFGEIPLDPAAQDAAAFGAGEIVVERMRVGAVDVNLGEQGERDVVIERAEILD